MTVATLQNQRQAEQWRRMQQLAMMKENLQKTNQWAQQGNTGALLGDIAGSWLQGYLGKLLEKLFIKDSGRKVNAGNVDSGVTDALNQGLGGTPEELLQKATGYNPTPSYDFPNSNSNSDEFNGSNRSYTSNGSNLTISFIRR